ncbi:5234_t:CDS:2, partial [Dentiscutata erythropus]
MKVTTSLYKQLDWFKNEGSEEEKKSAKRILQQFKIRSCFCKLRGSCDREHGGLQFLDYGSTLLQLGLRKTTRLWFLNGDGLQFLQYLFMNLQKCIYKFWTSVIAKRHANLEEVKVTTKV